MHGLLAARMLGFSATRDWTLLALMLPLGMAFGAIHAMTPGHGKSLLAAYLVGAPLSAWRGLVVAGVQAVTHVGSAVVIAVAALPLISRTLGGVGRAPSLEHLSYGMLMVIGLWLILRALRGHRHGHAGREGVMVGITAGLIPCPLTLFAMVMAQVRGVPEAGLAFAAAMVLGVGFTLGAVALLATRARRLVLAVTDRFGGSLDRWTRGLDAVSGLLIISLAVQQGLA